MRCEPWLGWPEGHTKPDLCSISIFEITFVSPLTRRPTFSGLVCGLLQQLNIPVRCAIISSRTHLDNSETFSYAPSLVIDNGVPRL